MFGKGPLQVDLSEE